MRFTHVALKLTFVLFIFSFSIASSAAEQKSQTDCEGNKMSAEKGSMTLSVTVNAFFTSQFDTLRLAKIESGKVKGDICELVALNSDVSIATKYFFGRLPAGDYRIVGVGNSIAGFAGNEVFDTADEIFRILPKKHSDLGRVVLSGEAKRPLWGIPRFSVRRSKRILANDRIERFDKQTIENPPLENPWMPSSFADNKVEENVLLNPFGFEPSIVLDNDRQAIRAGAGGIWISGHAGEWQRLVADHMEIILDVMPAKKPGDDPIAVGELNFMSYFDLKGNWRPISTGNLPLGNILFLEGNSVSGWHLFHQIGRDITIYHSTTLESGNWIKVRSEFSQTLTLPNHIKSFWVLRTKAGFVYGVSSGNINFYNVETDQWRASQTPEQASIVDMKSFDGGITLLTYKGGEKDASGKFVYIAGLAGKAIMSNDEGVSWKQVTPPKKPMRQALFISAKGDWVFSGLGLTATSAIYSSQDLGNTWSHSAQQSDSLSVISGSGDRLYATGPFEILSSVDGGKSWVVEQKAH